jgi:hypothetical protein
MLTFLHGQVRSRYTAWLLNIKAFTYVLQLTLYISGQLADVLQNVLLGSVSLPLSLRVEVTSLVTQMESISKQVINNLKDTDYYKSFEPVVSRAWNSSYSIRHVTLSSVPRFEPDKLKAMVHNYDEPRGDRCFEEIFGSARLPNNRK